jgi:hypothetical protein
MALSRMSEEAPASGLPSNLALEQKRCTAPGEMPTRFLAQTHHWSAVGAGRQWPGAGGSLAA